MSAYLGIHDEPKNTARQTAWLYMLGIDPSGQEIQTHRELYKMFLEEKAAAKSVQGACEGLIIKDVNRTFSGMNLFLQNPATGTNKLFNVLKVYSLYDPDVGYTQGMSFIAAVILMVIEDEALAWTVFVKILSVSSDWRRMFGENTPKLFEVSKNIRTWIK